MWGWQFGYGTYGSPMPFWTSSKRLGVILKAISRGTAQATQGDASLQVCNSVVWSPPTGQVSAMLGQSDLPSRGQWLVVRLKVAQLQPHSSALPSYLPLRRFLQVPFLSPFLSSFDYSVGLCLGIDHGLCSICLHEEPCQGQHFTHEGFSQLQNDHPGSCFWWHKDRDNKVWVAQEQKHVLGISKSS